MGTGNESRSDTPQDGAANPAASAPAGTLPKDPATPPDTAGATASGTAGPRRLATLGAAARQLLARIRRHACYPRGWRSALFDVALAAGAYFLGTPPVASMTPAPQNPFLGDMSDAAICIAWSMALILPVACRRLAPVATAWLFAVICLVQLMLGPCFVPLDLLCLVMLYTAIVYGNRSSARTLCLTALGVGAVASFCMGYTDTRLAASLTCSALQSPSATVVDAIAECNDAFVESTGTFAVLIALSLAFTIVVAFWRRTTRDSMLLLRERTEVLARQKEQAGREAARQERTRIARDMHDVVAHTLSTIIVQADGGRYAAANDPAKARGIMLTIRRETDHARSDMAQLLGVLTDGLPTTDGTGTARDGEASRHAESPGVSYERIPELIAQASVGSAVTHVVSGTPRPDLLSSNASICAYRVVQEALTNVRKYALGAAYGAQLEPQCTVHVQVAERWDGAGLNLRITDDGIGEESSSDCHTPGFGLMGMAERLHSVGGTLHAGPQSATEGPGTPGFAVEAFIPCSGAPSAFPGPTSADVPHAFGPVPATSSRPSLPADASLVAPAQQRRNIVERMAAWSISHERGSDVISTVLLCLLTALFESSFFGTEADSSFAIPDWGIALLPIVTCLPLYGRRRHPERSCLLVFLLCVVNMLVGTSQLPGCIVPVVAALFSGTLYGRRGFGKRLVALSVLGSALFGLNLSFFEELLPDGSVPVQGLAFSLWRPDQIDGEDRGIGISYALISLIVCLTAIGLGNLSHSRNENLTLLRARAEALEQERDARDKAAAIEERTRIGAQIQHDVSSTLDSVGERVDAGLAVLDSGQATPDDIRSAFADIAAQGRSALRRMRQLLGVLRDTGREWQQNAPPDAPLPEHDLHPAAPLDEQLHDSGLGHATSG